jgi:DNA mismatch repair protein MLH3
MTDSPIPELKLCSTFGPNVPDPGVAGSHWHDCNVPRKISSDGSADSHSHRFCKDDLRSARIISQVDQKFIACLLENQSDKGHALVLIDQHAADERVRVESFLKELCLGFLHDQGKVKGTTVQIRELLPPIPVLLTLREAQQLKDSPPIQAAFRHWGFRFVDLPSVKCRDPEADQVTDGDGNLVYTQVLIQGIPEVVGDKVRADFQFCKLMENNSPPLVTNWGRAP